MCCIGIEPSTAPWSLAAFASGRVLPVRTVNFASLTVLTIACFGNPLGTAKTDDVASNEQMQAKAKEIDFMILPYVFMTGWQAQSLPNPIATSRASHATRQTKGAADARLTVARTPRRPIHYSRPIGRSAQNPFETGTAPISRQ
jgi:hypothetical protein